MKREECEFEKKKKNKNLISIYVHCFERIRENRRQSGASLKRYCKLLIERKEREKAYISPRDAISHGSWRRKENILNNEIEFVCEFTRCIVTVSKMREQQLSVWPASKQGWEKKKKGDYYGEAAKIQWTGFVEIRGKDRSPFLPGFTPSGTENSRLTGGRDASRVGRRYFGGLRRGERETINDKPR